MTGFGHCRGREVDELRSISNKRQLGIIYFNPTGNHLWNSQAILWVESPERVVQAVACDMLSTQIARDGKKMSTQANTCKMNLDPLVNLTGTPTIAFLYRDYGSISET